ncbi:phosphatase PAP2 family protein [uncultured Sunxiuqinia sp.]|uniref:phosphatase PAP2 family protein n=1 Tax=Sunxiuqinia rutila TaxID=1397841 RepID=UPI002601F198|nr:phosphatase PAP2 family protein [uncultured Sunxiuqinia sp.]
MAMGIKQTVTNLYRSKGFTGFLYAYGVFLVLGIIVFLTTQHGDVVLFLNRYSRIEWDGFVEFLTDLGLGTYVAGAMVLLLFWKIRYGLTGLVTLGLVGIFTNLLKKGVFDERMRPFNYFYYDDFHRFIYTAELNYHYSFPSGHTMTIFAAMSLMAYFAGKRWIGLLFFVLALSIGFSRIYLLQHFFLDVYVGSFVGVICTVLALMLLNGLLRLDRYAWFEKPIHRIRFKK